MPTRDECRQAVLGCLATHGDEDLCSLEPLRMPRCDRPAFYEMDIDGNEKWIPLCVEHGPMYRRSSNVRIRTRSPISQDDRMEG